MDLSEKFRAYSAHPDSATELSDQEFLLYREKSGEAMTPAQLKETLKDKYPCGTKGVSLLAYLLYTYEKPVSDFETPEEHPMPEHTKAKFDEAIAVYQASLDADRSRQAKIQELAAKVEAGGAKGLAAKAELEQLRSEDELAANKRRVEADKRRRDSKKLIDQHAANGEARKQATLQGEAQRLAQIAAK